MKKILFMGVSKKKDFFKIEFRVNWLEYLILKNIFKNKRFTCFELKIKGQQYDLLVTDEVVRI